MDTIDQLPPIAGDDVAGARAGAVDLWCFFYERVADPELLRRYDALMTDAERARHGRFYFERDRLLFLATRALVRAALSTYADVPPGAWRFAAGERGKPFIVGPEGVPPLHFNLTNTRGLVVCAISTTHAEIGVDAEWLERGGETVEVADRYFSPLEVQALRALPTSEQHERFFRYWTLKESYIKARGLGLALPLDQFTFLLDEPGPIRIAFDPRLNDDPARWRFAQFSASAGHRVAVGVATGGTPLTLRACNYIPLRGAIPFEAVRP